MDVQQLSAALASLERALGVGPAPHGTVNPLYLVLQDGNGNIIGGGGGGSITNVIRALVNQLGGLGGGQPTFPFDNVTDLYGTSGITAGTAQNNDERGFVDNEPVILTSFNGLTWLSDKIADNAIAAFVNQAGGVITTDAEFDFNGAVAIRGVIPPGGIGTVVNFPASFYADNEEIVLNLIEQGTDAGKWHVVQDETNTGGGATLEAGFGIDEDELNDNEVIEVDRREETQYDDQVIQVTGHDGASQLLWFDVKYIEINLSNA